MPSAQDARPFFLPNRLDRCQAIHERHFEVTKDHVVGFYSLFVARKLNPMNRVKRFLPVVRHYSEIDLTGKLSSPRRKPLISEIKTLTIAGKAGFYHLAFQHRLVDNIIPDNQDV